MPTILIVAGLRIVVYPNDHGPPHVHVLGRDWSVKIELGDCAEAKPSLVRVDGEPTRRELRQALAAVDRNCPTLRTAWRSIHGAQGLD